VLVAIGILIGVIVGGTFAVIGAGVTEKSRLGQARRLRKQIVDDANREAESLRREGEIGAREEAVRLRAEIDAEVSEHRARIVKVEERVLAKEEEIDGKLTELARRDQGLADRETHLRQLQEEQKTAREEQIGQLERISGMTVNEAKQHLLERAEDLVRHELARQVRQLEEEEARIEAKRRARNLVADALQRVAASHAAETTVSVVELPSDDMKGRIIGREGRNIRSLEHLTGVDFIIDDTPNAVVLSSFAGMRREIAKLSMT
jgi:ribonuclease Y